MKIVPSLDFVPKKTDLHSFGTMLQKVYRNLSTAFNGNIGFGDGVNPDNINGVWQAVTFPLANTNVTVIHNLGRVPVSILPMLKGQAGDVFLGSVAPTKTQITLQCSTAGMLVNLFIS